MKERKLNSISSELEIEKRKLVNEINKHDDEMRKNRRKKIIKLFSIIIIIVLIIKVFFGTIELYNVFGYSKSKARYYKVTINDKQVPVSYTLRHKVPIIPYLVNFNSYYLGNSYIKGQDNNTFKADGSSKYILNINSFSCYYDEKYLIECTNNGQYMKENNDTKYSNLKITRTSNPYNEVYNGKYIDDITPYVTTNGIYHIEITAKYGLIETKVYFYFDSF